MSLSPTNPVLVDYPNPHSNVFLMMRFRRTKQHAKISEAISSILAEYSLNMIRADLKEWRDQLWDNVRSCMDASLYGIAVFEQIDERDINPNVSLEVGYMFAQGKKCLLLKEKRVPALQADLMGHLYHEFDSYHIEKTVKAQVRRWIRDLGIAKRSNERMIVYVSQGGTCRCAMAKAITRKLLQRQDPGYKLRVESVAYGEPGLPGASSGARRAIKEMYGADLLEDHRTVRLTPTIKKEADLILVMDHGLLKGLPPEKAHVLKPFLGLEGDITDPWPDDNDDVAAIRYRKCAMDLKEMLDAHMDKIILALKPR